jgi:glycosyltransferase involved in cell wall biosynthesis
VRIAQVAPLTESVPPSLYGGTERIVSYLAEELVALGHEVTLFASGDSQTGAVLHAGAPRALRLDPDCRDPLAYHVLMLEEVAQAAPHFDIVHFHLDWLHFPLFRRLRVPFVTTTHGRLDLPELKPLFGEFLEVPLVSISAAQRGPLHWANWIGTVHHGLPPSLLRPSAEDAGYLAFLGRISPEKGPVAAIRIALASGRPLKIAAKVDKVDKGYFEREVEPLLGAAGIEYIGEIGERDKSAFLGGAAALLFPIDWPEPFGLVMIEAMACGTPVIAYDRGAVREVIEDGVTGFIVDGVGEAVEAIGRLGTLDRAAIRHTFERRFTSQRMAEDYLALYRSLSQPPMPTLEAV